MSKRSSPPSPDPTSYVAELRRLAKEPAPSASRARVLGRLESSLGLPPDLAPSSPELRPEPPSAGIGPEGAIHRKARSVSGSSSLAAFATSSPWIPVVTFALGVSSGVVAHAAFGTARDTHDPRGQSPDAPPSIITATPTPGAEASTTRAGAPATPPPAPARSGTEQYPGARAESDRNDAADAGQGPRRGPVGSRSLAAAADKREAPKPNPRPAPEGAGAPLPPPSHQALLDEARRALAHQDAARALAALDEHTRLYPRSTLAEERGALRVRALAAAGSGGEALDAAERFEMRYPRSLYLPSVRRSVSRFHDGTGADRPKQR